MANPYSLLDGVAVPVFVLEPDEQGRPVYAAFNRTACQIARLDAGQVVGRTALELYPGRWGEAAYAQHCRAMQRKSPSIYELVLPLGGKQRTIRTQMEPILDASGKIARLIGTSEDVSAEQDMEEMRVQTDTLAREMEEFVTQAAHDLRSPIRNVHALADLLRKDFQDLGDGKLEIINMLETVASTTMTLIGDVISHAQATNATESIENFSLADAGGQILTMLDPTSGHDAVFDDVFITADRVAVQIVLRNLLDNAIKHNPGQRLQIQVTAQQVDRAQFAITIEDDGAGFPDAVRASLADGKMSVDGSFGLAGIRRLVHARGGSIEILSRDTGAAVRFQLQGQVEQAALTA